MPWGRTNGTSPLHRHPTANRYQFNRNHLEQHITPPDHHLIQAARSLHHNRALAERVQARTERAEARLWSWLALTGQTQAMFGIYEVELVDDALLVTPHFDPGAEQLAIPDAVFGGESPSVDADEDTAEPGLTAFDRQVLANATAGLLPCPCCGEPLLGQPSHIAGEPTIHLFCPDSQCGFEEV